MKNSTKKLHRLIKETTEILKNEILHESEKSHSFKKISKTEVLSTVSKNNVCYEEMAPLVGSYHI